MERTRVGVIGCGAHGVGGHVAGYAQLEEVEITAVCDTRIERAQEAAAKFGVPNVYGDHREMLARHELDIVSVCTPVVAHKEGTVDAFRAGAHVLCEKPLAMNALEAEEMIAAAKESGKLMSMHGADQSVPCVQPLAQGLLGGGRTGTHHPHTHPVGTYYEHSRWGSVPSEEPVGWRGAGCHRGACAGSAQLAHRQSHAGDDLRIVVSKGPPDEVAQGDVAGDVEGL